MLRMLRAAGPAALPCWLSLEFAACRGRPGGRGACASLGSKVRPEVSEMRLRAAAHAGLCRCLVVPIHARRECIGVLPGNACVESPFLCSLPLPPCAAQAFLGYVQQAKALARELVTQTHVHHLMRATVSPNWSPNSMIVEWK